LGVPGGGPPAPRRTTTPRTSTRQVRTSGACPGASIRTLTVMAPGESFTLKNDRKVAASPDSLSSTTPESVFREHSSPDTTGGSTSEKSWRRAIGGAWLPSSPIPTQTAPTSGPRTPSRVSTRRSVCHTMRSLLASLAEGSAGTPGKPTAHPDKREHSVAPTGTTHRSDFILTPLRALLRITF